MGIEGRHVTIAGDTDRFAEDTLIGVELECTVGQREKPDNNLQKWIRKKALSQRTAEAWIRSLGRSQSAPSQGNEMSMEVSPRRDLIGVVGDLAQRRSISERGPAAVLRLLLKRAVISPPMKFFPL
jgi:hypothetical protein